MIRWFWFSLLLVLAGCMSFVSSFKASTIFQPFNGNYGYSHIQLSEAFYEVGFSASDRFTPIQLKELALIRAAELAKERNFSYMEVVSTKQELINLGTIEETTSSFTPADSSKKGKKETTTKTRQNNRYDVIITVKFFSESNNTPLLYVDTILSDAKQNPYYRSEENQKQ